MPRTDVRHLVVGVAIVELHAIASLPTASIEARSETLSSYFDRAQSADMTVPPGPTQYLGPPHSNEKTLTFPGKECGDHRGWHFAERTHPRTAARPERSVSAR